MCLRAEAGDSDDTYSLLDEDDVSEHFISVNSHKKGVCDISD